jgi:hypothetical protein
MNILLTKSKLDHPTLVLTNSWSSRKIEDDKKELA